MDSAGKRFHNLCRFSTLTDAFLRIIGNFQSFGTNASSTGRRRLTLILAIQRRTAGRRCNIINRLKRTLKHVCERARIYRFSTRTAFLMDTMSRILLTTSRLLVRIILAIFLLVAQLRFKDTFRFTIRSSARTQKLSRARDRRTVRFVAAVVTIGVTVAVIISRYTATVRASKLANVTGGKICNQIGISISVFVRFKMLLIVVFIVNK